MAGLLVPNVLSDLTDSIEIGHGASGLTPLATLTVAHVHATAGCRIRTDTTPGCELRTENTAAIGQ